MTSPPRLRGVLTAMVFGMLVTGCSAGERPQLSAKPAQATAVIDLETIAGLLDAGEVGQAKKRIFAALKRDPGNASLMMLSDSIDKDPVSLLGPDNYFYTVRQGDTIASLAQRMLGNRLKSHQLARYNSINGPAVLMAGQTLRIPGQLNRPEVVKRPERPPEIKVGVVRPKTVPAARPQTSAVAAPSANLAAARQARSAGLAALNDGNPGRAVSLLSRASTLDPGNAAIARDLNRAQRINATVKSRQ